MNACPTPSRTFYKYYTKLLIVQNTEAFVTVSLLYPTDCILLFPQFNVIMTSLMAIITSATPDLRQLESVSHQPKQLEHTSLAAQSHGRL